MKKLMTIAALVGTLHATPVKAVDDIAVCFILRGAAESVMNARQVGLPFARAVGAIGRDLDGDIHQQRIAASQLLLVEAAYEHRVAWTRRGRDNAVRDFMEKVWEDCRDAYQEAP